MKHSRLKNIINKAKELSNNKLKIVGESPFDLFKKSLPIEIDDNYRLEAAWKAYGKPKDYKSALWEGLIQPIDENNVKLPSIGYNEETDEYEYLNKGKDNEIVAKDIRVWDNDVIPLVQELKLGGYVRTFNKEKDCWTYTKNSQKRELSVEDKGEQVIEEFKSGGKKKIKIYLEGDSKEGEYIEVDSLDDDLRAGRKPIGKDSKGRNRYLNGDNKAVLNLGGRQNGDIPGFLEGGKSEYKKVKSDKAYYDKDSDIVYYTNDEDLIHEGFHARPDSVLLEQLKPYYENLNDEKILNFGGNLLFVKRFEGDPGHFYSPEELGARVSAAKFRTKGNNYTPEFFKYLRTNENLYGDNMRDLLYMYNDENLSKIFNLGNTQAFKQDGKPKRNMELLITYANNQKPPFIQRILNNDERSIPLIMEDGKKYHGTHLLSYGERNGKTYVFPEILDFDGDLIRLNWPANLDTAIERGDFLEMTPEEAELFTKEYKKFYPNYKPFKMEGGGELSYFKQGGQVNVIPEGALHCRKNNMEGAGEDFTAKGIPVVDNNGEQQAEIEKNEVIFTKDLTDFIENNLKKFNSEETSNSEKDEIAIKVGKRLVKELLTNTDDRTGLIEEVLEKI